MDATGKYLLPGCIDAHVHFDMPFMGTFSADDFITGTRSDSRGGVTTIIDFAIPAKGESLEDAPPQWLEKAQGQARVAFRVAGRNNSRIVLDQNGAEVLLGRGDMLFLRPAGPSSCGPRGPTSRIPNCMAC